MWGISCASASARRAVVRRFVVRLSHNSLQCVRFVLNLSSLLRCVTPFCLGFLCQASTASRSPQAANAKIPTVAATPATTPSRRAKQEKGRGTLTATRARPTSADAAKPAPEPMLLSPRLLLKPLTTVPAAPQATGEDHQNAAQSVRSRSSYHG